MVSTTTVNINDKSNNNNNNNNNSTTTTATTSTTTTCYRFSCRNCRCSMQMRNARGRGREAPWFWMFASHMITVCTKKLPCDVSLTRSNIICKTNISTLFRPEKLPILHTTHFLCQLRSRSIVSVFTDIVVEYWPWPERLKWRKTHVCCVEKQQQPFYSSHLRDIQNPVTEILEA